MTKTIGEPDPPRVGEVPDTQQESLEALEVEVVSAALPRDDDSSLFEGLELEVRTPSALERPNDGIPPLDSDLTADEKREFVKLLNKEMPLAARAKQLGVLARMKGSKTAAVGLRALVEINSLTGLSKEQATESAPLFQLPPDTTVSVKVTKVAK